MSEPARQPDPATWPRRTWGQAAATLLPFVILAAVAAVYLVVGPGVGILPLLSLGPAFAALTGDTRFTVLAGVVALALSPLLASAERLFSSDRDLVAVATIVGVTAASVIASAARRRREKELADVHAIADVAQQVLLPRGPVRSGPVQVAVRYVSATARANIGGDLYEVMAIDDGLRLIIGDVQGKGLPAVKTAAAVLAAFRESYDIPDLPSVAARIEASLTRQIDDEQFVTAILGEVSHDGSRVALVNYGHPAPLLLPREGSPRFIEPEEPGLPLGLAHLSDHGAPEQSPSRRRETTVALGRGDWMLLYTDGVSEARDRSGAFYPLADSAALLRDREDPDRALERLTADVSRHVGHPLDDDAATLLLARAVAETEAGAPAEGPDARSLPAGLEGAAAPGPGGALGDRAER